MAGRCLTAWSRRSAEQTVFLPLHDDNPIKHIRFQFVTVTVIGLCVAVYLYQFGLDANAGQGFVLAYGAIPAVIFGEAALPPEIAVIPGWASLVTSAFLHGGWMHLIGNMVFLWVLGDNVEDNLGHRRYIVFYLLCGLAAALTHAAIDPGSKVPMIGASGAVSGVIGAYLVLHPKAPIRTLVGYFIVSLPAWVVLGMWAGLQLFNIAGGGGGGVAWWAHVGGLIAGAVLIIVMRPRGVPLLDRDYSKPADAKLITRSRFPNSGKIRRR